MAQVTVVMDSREAALWRAQQKLIAQEAKMAAGYRDIGRQSQRAHRRGQTGAEKSTSALGKMTAQIRSVAAGWISAQAAVQGFMAAEAERQRLAEAGRDAQLSVGQSQAAVIKNIGDVSNDEARAFLKRVDAIRQATGFASVAPLNMAASSILSGTGGNQRLTLDILRQSAPFFKDAPDQMAGFGGSLADVMRVTGDQSVRRNIGLLLAIQGQARFESLDAFKNVAPALASGGVVTEGNRVQRTRESGALFAAIGQRIGDPDGTITKGAVVAIEKNLAQVVPEAQTTFERLRVVWEDTTGRLADAVVGGGGFRGATVPVIQELLKSRDTQTGKMLTDAFEKIQGSEQAVTRKAQQLMRLTPELRAVTATAAAGGAIEDLQRGGGATAIAAGVLTQTLEQQRNIGALGLDLLGAQGMLDRLQVQWFISRGGTPQEAVGMLRSRIIQPGQPTPAVITPEQIQRNNDLLQRQIEVLDALQQTTSPAQAAQRSMSVVQQQEASAASPTVE